jgi:hypothetical protein
MNIKKWLLVFGISCSGLSIAAVGHATEKAVVNGKVQTPFTIQVVENPLRLSKVQAPTFDTYIFDKGTNNIQLSASRDLVIEVEDKRIDDLSTWGIQYTLSMFNDVTDSTKIDTKMTFDIGKGDLSIGTEKLDATFYTGYKASLSAEDSIVLVQTKAAQTATFSYRVPKEEIKVNLPGQLREGVYQAQQTITLVNVPVVDN